MKSQAITRSKPKSLPCIGCWTLFKEKGQQKAILIVGSRELDRYLTVTSSQAAPITRTLVLLNGVRSQEDVARQLLSEGIKIDVEAVCEKAKSAGLLLDDLGEPLPVKGDFRSQSVPIATIDISGLSFHLSPTTWRLAGLLVLAINLLCFALIVRHVILFSSWTTAPIQGSGTDPILYGSVFVLSFLIHEAAHGLMALAHGLTPRRIEASLYLGIVPTFFLKIGGLYTLSSAVRIQVWLSGIWANITIAEVALTANALKPNAWPHLGEVIATVNLMISVFNLFPFLPTDGYFVLSTLMRRYNVRKSAFQHTRDLLTLRFSSDSLLLGLYLLGTTAALLWLLYRQVSTIVNLRHRDPLWAIIYLLILIAPCLALLYRSVRKPKNTNAQRM